MSDPGVTVPHRGTDGGEPPEMEASPAVPAGTRTPVEATSCLLCGSDQAVPYLESEVQLTPDTGEAFPFVTCGECGLVYLSPRPTEEGVGRFYTAQYPPHRGAEAWGRWAPLVRMGQAGVDRRRVRLIRRLLGNPAGRRILDVGCGRPTFLRRLSRVTGVRGVGVDVSGQGWSDGSWDDLTLKTGTPLELEERLRAQAPDGFDVLTLWHTLEHDYRPRKTLEALHRLAAPGAILVVEVPDLDSLTARLHGSEWAGLHTPRHTAAYTPDTLVRMVRAARWRFQGHWSRGTVDPWVLRWLSLQNRRGNRLDGSLENFFPAFLAGKISWLPLTLLQSFLPLGVQTLVARRPPA
jgi:SAM-dependent methyltransferase